MTPQKIKAAEAVNTRPAGATALDDLEKILEPFRKEGQRIVFTNGCFDILHVGHVRYLAAARAEGDVLVVGLNSDRSVKAIKGEKRPLLSQGQRAEVLSALECVDFVVFFETPDPFKLIERIQPDVLVKGADWGEGQIIGADVVRASGGKVVRIPLAEGVSTTGIIERICRRYCRH